MEILVFWIIMAVIVAMVANSKDRSAVAWFFYGLLIWPIALVHAILLKPQQVAYPEPPRTRTFIHPPPSSPAVPGSAPTPSQRAPASLDPLDAETLRVAAEWRAKGRDFAMIEAREEARLLLLDRKAQGNQAVPDGQPKPTGKVLEPDPFRLAAFPGSFPQMTAGGGSPEAASGSGNRTNP